MNRLQDDVIDTVLATMLMEWTAARYTDAGMFAVNTKDEWCDALSDQACAWCVVGYMRVVLARVAPLELIDDYERAIVKGLEDCIDKHGCPVCLVTYSDVEGHAATIVLIQAYQASRASTPVLSSWRRHTETV